VSDAAPKRWSKVVMEAAATHSRRNRMTPREPGRHNNTTRIAVVGAIASAWTLRTRAAPDHDYHRRSIHLALLRHILQPPRYDSAPFLPAGPPTISPLLEAGARGLIRARDFGMARPLPGRLVIGAVARRVPRSRAYR